MCTKLFVPLAAFIISTTAFVSCNTNEKKAESQSASGSSTSPIEGAWETVLADGKISQLKMWHDGFFSFLMQDSSGKWSIAGTGTYSVDGNTYKETFRY